MRKIIPLRLLIGYSIIIAACSALVAVNLNILHALRTHDSFDLTHVNQNYYVRILAELNDIAGMPNEIFKVSLVIAAIFIFATISSIIEAQASNLAKLSLIGANKTSIAAIFFFALLRPFSVAIIIGTAIGIFSSHYLSRVYGYINGGDMNHFSAAFHFSSLAETVGIMVGILFLGIIAGLKKILSVNPLGITSGKYKDFSRISIVRIICGFIMIALCLWFYSTVHIGNDNQAGNAIMVFALLVIICCYFFVPAALRIFAPILFRLLSRIFPITSLIAKRYFNASIRKYTSLTAPMLICLMFTSAWFFIINNGQNLNKKLYADMPFSAVATQVNSHDNVELHKYIDIENYGKNAHALPYILDKRWAQEGDFQENPLIAETDPQKSVSDLKISIISGDMSKVHGLSVASSVATDKLGDTIHFISSAGKITDAHIVAKVTPNIFSAMGYIVDYKTFPETNTVDQPYTIFYTGIPAHDLILHGLNAVPYTYWVNNIFLPNKFRHAAAEHYLDYIPILFVCLALVIINSSALSENDGRIRKVVSTLGGSNWQDIRILFIQMGLVSALCVAITPVPTIFITNMMEHYMKNIYDRSDSLIYPYQQVVFTFIFLICATAFLPIAKMQYSRRKIRI